MGRASVPTPALYPAFFFVLEKAVKSAGNAVIPTFPTHRSHGLQHLRHKRSTFAFTPESGYTLGPAQRIAHNGSHGETRGVSDGGAITTLGAFHTFRKPCVARCQNGKLCRFWVLVGGTPEGHREPRDSDALMRVAVPRRRGPAGLRDLFRFCRNCGLYALRSGPFRVCEARGGITTLGVLCVLPKRRTAACQSG